MTRWFGVVAWLLTIPVTTTAADGLMSRQEISLGVDMGGTVVFRDTPDQLLEETPVCALDDDLDVWVDVTRIYTETNFVRIARF